jgi:hypothetical protein
MRVSPDRISLALTPFRVAALLALAGALAVAAPSRAVTIGDTNPLFFNGPDGFGFVASEVAAAGLAAAFQADADDTWLVAGKKSPKVDLAISVDLQDVFKEPNKKGKKPTVANPIIADSIWTVTNKTGEALDDVLLVFTLGNTNGRKNHKPVGLDGNLVDILAAEGPGSSIDVDVRYIVGGRLGRQGNKLLLPRFGTSAVTGATPVPEPATGAAVALGLLALAAARRR